jgi:Ulp1 family protease
VNILDFMMDLILDKRREDPNSRGVVYISSLSHDILYLKKREKWKVSPKKWKMMQSSSCLEERKPLVIFGFNPGRIHWKLVEADPLLNTIVHWCSLQDQYSDTTWQTRSVVAYFKAYALRPDTNREWKIHLSNEDHCSRQSDSYNCGVFYLLHCFFVLNGYSKYANRLNELDLKKVRLWICYCLVKGEFIDPLGEYSP